MKQLKSLMKLKDCFISSRWITQKIQAIYPQYLSTIKNERVVGILHFSTEYTAPTTITIFLINKLNIKRHPKGGSYEIFSKQTRIFKKSS